MSHPESKFFLNFTIIYVVYSESIVIMQKSVLRFCVFYSRPHTINNIVNIRRIDNIIDRVRSCIDVLTEILTVFRKTGKHFINTRCIDLVIYYIYLAYTGRYYWYWHSGIYRQAWRILAQWLLKAGMADTTSSTMAYLIIIIFWFDGSRSDNNLN